MPEAPVVAGYRFLGWNPDYTKTPVEANESGFARATPEYVLQCVVNFIDYDGSCIATRYVDVGSAAVAPSMVGKTAGRRVFFGWDKDFSCVESDLSVKAIYCRLNYTPTEPEVDLPCDGTEQILFKNMKISKVIGVRMNVFFRYSTSSSTRYEGEFSGTTANRRNRRSDDRHFLCLW